MGRGKHNSSSMLCKCCYSGENAINFSSLFLVNVLRKSRARCYGGGDITGLSTHVVEKYVEEATKFNFIHVVKEEEKGTRRQASLFYIQTRNKSYQYDEDRDRGPFKFYAAKYFNSDRKVNYTLDEEADINDENKPKKRKVIEIIDDDLSSEENSETIQQAREGTYPVAKEAANITGEHVKDFSEGRKGFQETAKGGAKQLATQFKSRVSDYAKPLNVAYGLYENEIEAISAKIEVEHGISTITLRKIYYGSTYLDPKKCKANNFDPIKKIGMSSMGRRASADDQNSQKRDEERRSSGRKEEKEEFSVTEISGPPAQKDWSHFTGDRMKIVKMLKTLMNRYAMLCLNSDIRIVKLYGMQFTVSQ
ncbi:hypothetical protein GLOIN_2v1848412 [Rhizophagus irregularis DAOM 181602=DAOM 197198]|nr:hypothetical protein GLOIN_2v1848412 [Rhizophagus irregularis DAOM 181602=DAOM 197198]